MRSAVCSVALLAVAAVSARAAIDGTVLNRTSGKAQAGVSITLVKPGQSGMTTLGSTASDASGHFAFANDQPGGGPQLLQAAYKGVTYNKLLTPAAPTTDIVLDVYEATSSPAEVRVAQRMLLIEPSLSAIAMSETVVVENDTKLTYNDAAQGGLRFYLPPAANGQVRVQAQGPQGMPLPRAAERTDEGDIYKVAFPIKPGETQFQVSYNIPAGTPFTYRGKIANVKGMKPSPLRVVVPPGVTVTGDDLRNSGTEPRTQLTIYTVTKPGNFSFDITGTGSLHPADTNDSADSSDSPPLTQGPPQIYRHLSWLVFFAFSILGLGLITLFRASSNRQPQEK